MNLEWWTSVLAKILDIVAKKCWENLLKARIQCYMLSVQKPHVAGARSLEEWNWKDQHLLLPKFWTTMWRNADEAKPSQSVVSVLWAFSTETTFRRNLNIGSMNLDWWALIVAKVLKNDLKKCWQNRLKVRFECSMPSVQKPLFADTSSFEAWTWSLTLFKSGGKNNEQSKTRTCPLSSFLYRNVRYL